ncbi:hypothetical protein DENIS_0178 [Desulfonema ishimotonii]|uniref:Uncharacterized protein n=1 Tax=Desulfonema ishimotonii TaxID=45657 RepID=A0A401FQN1_9BACT|nr:PKD domain-containing protein [Desulfonema ishimotonii]GBC59242.1 hypothetical protein DENIS_0178 [Desulfonema ishimotonii]
MMRHKFLSCIWILLIVAMGYGFPEKAARAACPDGMIAYWPLNEDEGGSYADGVGDHTGQCGDVCPAPVSHERINGSQAFDGSSAGISVPGDAAFDWGKADSFSIEWWMKRGYESPVGDEVVIGRRDTAGGLAWWAGLSADGTAHFSLTDTDGVTHSVTGSENLTDGVWHHIVAIRNAEDRTLLLFVDSQIAATKEIAIYSGGFEFTDEPLSVGWAGTEGAGYFNGLIDEVSVYNGVLSEALIADHVADGLADFRQGYCETPQPIKIMPLGDSVTAGLSAADGEVLEPGLMIGYRQALYQNLTAAGYDVDFVGSQIYGNTASSAFDTDNEGHPGGTDAQIAANIFDWLSLNPAQIVLLHIGTESLPGDTTGVEAILDEIDRFDQTITVVLARIINQATYSLETAIYNTGIAQMAEERIANGDKLIVADMENALTYPDDMASQLYPGVSGYEKMADIWRDHLTRFTAFPDQPPVITSTPVAEATVASPYTYAVRATGSPVLTYALASGPSGMVIDPSTGDLSWTPFDEGTFTAAVRVSNDVGYTEQHFTITVGPRENQPPVAKAGTDQMAVEGVRVTLNGSASYDPDGGIASYRWEQVSGTSVEIRTPDKVTTTFTAPGVSSPALSFRLTVTDAKGLTGIDYVNVVVNAASPPTADPGPDQSVSKGDTVTLNGAGSSASGGTQIVSWRWAQTSGMSVQLSAPQSAVTNFVAPNVGADGDTLIFTLTVTDSNGAEASEAVRITVAFVNLAPVSDAGQDQVVSEGTTVRLDGSGSYDSDGGIASYRWNQTSGTPVVLSDADVVQPTFVVPSVASDGVGFTLTVSDKDGLEAKDTVLITVNDNGIKIFPDNVVSFTTVTGRPMGIREENGGTLVRLSSLSDTGVGDALDRPENFIYGLADMAFLADQSGGTVTVTVFFQEPAPDGYLWYEYSSLNGWQSFGDDAVFNAERDQVTLTLTDGGARDSGTSVADGMITSRSGLGYVPPPEKDDKDDLLSCFIASAAAGSLPQFCILPFIFAILTAVFCKDRKKGSNQDL